MAFFQDLGGRISEAAQLVGKRTSAASTIGKLSREVTDIRSEMDRLYAQIGKVCYAAYLGQGDMQFTEQLCKKIDSLQAEARSIEAKIDHLRGQRRCPKCGEVSGDGAVFCAKCGEKLPPIEQVTVQPEPEDEAMPETQPGEAKDEEPARVRRDAGDVSVEINWPEAGGEAETPAEQESMDEA